MVCEERNLRKMGSRLGAGGTVRLLQYEKRNVEGFEAMAVVGGGNYTGFYPSYADGYIALIKLITVLRKMIATPTAAKPFVALS